MNATRKTAVAVRELGTTYHRLMGLIRFGKIEPPQRDSSGDYLWSDADLSRAREALKVDLRRKGAGNKPGEAAHAP
jgi:hypothetical protein